MNQTDALCKMFSATERQMKRLGRATKQMGRDPDFLAELLKVDVAVAIGNWLHEGHRTSTLCRRMGVSRQYLNRILNTQENLSLKTIARIAVAMGARPFLTFKKEPSSNDPE